MDIDKITPEMEANFKNYINGHKEKVVLFAQALYDSGHIGKRLFDKISQNHDNSKLEEPEYTPYVKRKWVERNYNVDMYDKMGDDIKAAIVHHVTKNDHHPEYWSNDYRGFETSDPCHVDDMSEDAVIEMVCDWNAMALERGNTARSWYDKTRDKRWIFDDHTNWLIDTWLKVFENGYLRKG